MLVVQKKAVPLHPHNRRKLLHVIGVWCNGNTTDSGPVILGSSPSTPTLIIDKLLDISAYRFFLLDTQHKVSVSKSMIRSPLQVVLSQILTEQVIKTISLPCLNQCFSIADCIGKDNVVLA